MGWAEIGGCLVRGQEMCLGKTRNLCSRRTQLSIHFYITLHSRKPIAMASQRSSRALRVALRQASAPRVQQRTFVSAVNAASRPSVQPAQKAIASSFVQQTRGAKTVDFAGDKEKVYGKEILVQRLQWLQENAELT